MEVYDLALILSAEQTQPTISVLWNSANSLQQSENCLCLRTGELRVLPVGICGIRAWSCPHHTPPFSLQLGWVFRSGWRRSRGVALPCCAWKMLMPGSTVHGSYGLELWGRWLLSPKVLAEAFGLCKGSTKDPGETKVWETGKCSECWMCSPVLT